MYRMLIALALVGCGDLFGPDYTFWGHRPMEPVPEVYAAWYAEVEVCLGRVGDFGAITWFVADSLAWNQRSILGTTDLASHEITMRSDHVLTEHHVRHEMVHEIMQADNSIHDERGDVPCEVEAIS